MSMKAFINGLEVPFKDLGEPIVIFEGEDYEVITDQTGAPFIQVGATTAYLEFRDDDGNDITPPIAEDEDEDDAEEDEPNQTAQTAQAVTEYKELVEENKLPKTNADPIKEEKKDPFLQAIESYVQHRGATDELFAPHLQKPNKSVQECVKYIYSEVQKTGRQGFTDEEVFGMAVHYYIEDDVKAPANVQTPRTVVNTAIAAPAPVELTEEQKEKARKLAVDNAIAKEAQRLATKKKAAAPVKPTEAQTSLF